MQGALLDYPAAIDYIVATTGYDDMHFVGYSMGTTQYLMLLSEMPGKYIMAKILHIHTTFFFTSTVLLDF